MPRILPYPHPALRYESRPVLRIDDELRTTIRTMFDLMYGSRGIGLAANQVGLPFRFFILNLTADPEHKESEQVFINPEIVKRHSSIEDEEGCLSFPGLHAHVRRARKIRVKAFDLEAKEIDLDAEDLLSRAIQHETDHLSGRLFIDYLDGAARLSAAAAIKEFESAYRRAQGTGEFPRDDDARRLLETMPSPALSIAQPQPEPVATLSATPQPA